MVWPKKERKKPRQRSLLAKIGWGAAGLAARESSQVGYSLSCQVGARYSESSELSSALGDLQRQYLKSEALRDRQSGKEGQ